MTPGARKKAIWSAAVPLLAVTSLGLAMGTARAQNGSQFRDWNRFSNDQDTASATKLECKSLASLTGYDFAITSAKLVLASGDVPEHCRVEGQVLPDIEFEVNLPTAWNARLYMFGNGGAAGEAFDAPARVAARNTALKHGLAVAATNTGHEALLEPLASFAVDREKLI